MNFEIKREHKELKASLRRLFKDQERFPFHGFGLDSSEGTRASLMECMRILKDAGYIKASMEGEGERIALQEELASFSPALFLSVEMGLNVFGGLLRLLQDSHLRDSLSKGRIIGTAFVLSDNVVIESHKDHLLLY